MQFSNITFQRLYYVCKYVTNFHLNADKLAKFVSIIVICTLHIYFTFKLQGFNAAGSHS